MASPVTISDGTNTVSYLHQLGHGSEGRVALRHWRQRLTASGTNAGLNVSRADGTNFTVTTSNSAVATAIGIASNTTTSNGVAAFDATAATVEADYDGAGITGLTASVSAARSASRSPAAPMSPSPAAARS